MNFQNILDRSFYNRAIYISLFINSFFYIHEEFILSNVLYFTKIPSNKLITKLLLLLNNLFQSTLFYTLFGIYFFDKSNTTKNTFTHPKWVVFP